MKDKDKKTKAKIVPKTSQAPDPPKTLRGSYIPPKDKPANYEYWNQFPIVSIHNAIYLTIEINPKNGGPEERKNREKFRELDELAEAHLTFGSLKLFPTAMGQVEVSVWQAWLLKIGWPVPAKWKPFKNEEIQPAPNQVAKDTVSQRIDEGLRAATAILERLNEDGNLPELRDLKTILSKSNVADEILRHPTTYLVCNDFMAKCPTRNNDGNFAERYPALAGNWPNFATHDVVLVAWKDLKSSQ